MKIRHEAAKDIEQVREILRAAFPSDAESKLVDALRANGKAMIALVAVQNDRVLGHIFFSPVTTAPPNDAEGIGLAPVPVHPNFQGQSIGSQLIQEGLRLGKELGYDYCVVLGDPKYYQRFGFVKASKFDIQNEYSVEEEFMVILFSDKKPFHCLVKYAPEFAMFLL